ncbi:hypothetical protein LSTR_LSTR000992 [Laodelphax striatellus]|uniref:Uncharacterized protein n=1 Tax=Laodelphax striatellus TaxID=195883 RepID=A0A482X2K3_LAOST|nr:hypothetical protein LSTR_LSTR000992 [Laodelphax striatellus]
MCQKTLHFTVAYNTRQTQMIHVEQVTSTLARNGPKFLSSKIYNKVPAGIRNIERERTDSRASW